MATKLTRLTHKIATQLQVMAESCTVCGSRTRRLVRELLDTLSYVPCYYLRSYMSVCALFQVMLPS